MGALMSAPNVAASDLEIFIPEPWPEEHHDQVNYNSWKFLLSIEYSLFSWFRKVRCWPTRKMEDSKILGWKTDLLHWVSLPHGSLAMMTQIFRVNPNSKKHSPSNLQSGCPGTLLLPGPVWPGLVTLVSLRRLTDSLFLQTRFFRSVQALSNSLDPKDTPRFVLQAYLRVWDVSPICLPAWVATRS